MNINDFDHVNEYPENLLEDIFRKQYELAKKYHPIEHSNGFWVGDTIEVNVHDKMGQQRIKDFCWRVTEEIMEALEAWNNGHLEHCQEEIADALHFFVELCLMVSIDPNCLDLDRIGEDDDSDRVSPPEAVTAVVYYLGLACNCLKNKPWKQTQMMTDVKKFRVYIIAAFIALMDLAYSAEIVSPEMMYDLYFRKNKVNQFRQESKY